ncbi:nitrate- and nitrite sensing domain-containing protein [Streptomyces sp. NBC_00237]|uniref:nitrate- and nitrite sensing domain-containing protein n=1 Tax=Streptomyces sp. NBC_00237 TaxID=2975687 RepID=UPI00224DDBF2|nr:nitrate- and nitrite sensing domain-containing protein [Streptomyces sp. NBC_00237]MCX5203985.1 nitrate- and nitrite sensing domain-containing protein [Streptomyces sp. NBC_00237]
MGSPQARQGRGDTPAEQEPRGGAAQGSSPQHPHAQNQGPAQPGGGPGRPGPTGGQGGPGAPGGAGGNFGGGTNAFGGGPAQEPPAAPGAAKGKKPKAPKPITEGTRISLRNWSISTRLVSLLALPVVAATALGGLRINQSLSDVQQLEHMQLLTDMTRKATDLAAALQNERDKTAGPLANGTPMNDATVKAEQAKSDRYQEAFIQGTSGVDLGEEGDESLKSIRASLSDISQRLGSLKDIRGKAFQNRTEAGNSQTVSAYSGLITSLLSLSQDMAQATSSPEMIKRTRALAAFSNAKEYASVQRAIIAAALPMNPEEQKVHLPEADRLFGQTARTNEKTSLETFSSIYGPKAEELLSVLTNNNPDAKRAEDYAGKALGSQDGIQQLDKRSYMDWSDQASNEIDTMKRIEATLLDDMEQKARELRADSERSTIISGAVILLVLGVSLVGAFIMARSMIRSLRRLQDTATRVAQERLPELVKALSESDPQDVDTSVESVGVHSKDEIGRVATAFDDVHREAVRLAAEQALLRGNVNAMFTNLSRRSQGLIQRQLSLISELEAREADPDQLSSLFKLDHLATRMRRNGENLLVLAGEEPGRRWTRPVPLVDVLRAAASEVEQYERIELSSVPSTEVAGRVVNDLVHLLAELLENATSFSSPQTKVRVTGHALPDGRVLVEIHDTGIGLSPEDLSAINERLAAPPTVDVSVSRRMGLFVVGRLSLRHGIRIQLRPSDSGGTTALVMLPVDVAQGGKKLPGKPGGPGLPGGQGGAPQMPSGQGNRPGLPGGPGAGGGPGSRPGAPQGNGMLGSEPSRRQVPAGSGPRAALPGRTPGAGLTGTPPASPAKRGGLAGAFGGGRGGREDVRQSHAPEPERGLPRANGPRAELPGGSSTPPQGGQPTAWGARPNPVDAPRGHEETESRQGPGATAEFDRPDFNGPPPGTGSPTGQFERPDVRQTPSSTGSTGQYERPDVRGAQGQDARAPQGPGSTGQFPQVRGPQDPASTGQYPQADTRGYQDPAATGQYPQAQHGGFQDPSATGQFPQADRGPQDRGYQDRGFQDPSSTGQYERPDVRGAQGQDARAPQGPGSTGQFPQVRGPQDPASTGQYPQADTRGYQDPAATGQYPQAQHGGFQDPSATGQFDSSDFAAATGQAGQPGQAGGFERPDVREPQRRPDPYDTGSHHTGPYDRPGLGAAPAAGVPQGPGAPRPRGTEGGRDDAAFRPPRPVASLPGQGAPSAYAQSPQAPQTPQPQQPQRADETQQVPQVQRQPDALPPAGPGDGRTPLFDTLESNWFHQEQGGAPQSASVPQQPTASAPEREGTEAAWRPSPNDELVRQAERVRKPAAGGVTTSGLPRRVPKANLVPGTAQEQNHQTGPQVSRAPEEVRGRLTNLRRGIQQGRQAGSNGNTGTFRTVDPTHQQER